MYDLLASADFYLYAIPAVILFGLSKGGLSGLGALATPIMALAISPVRAAAILLPIIIVQDWVGVWSFRRDFDRRNLMILIPASFIGVAAAGLLAARVSENGVRFAVGAISLGFVAFMLLSDRLPKREQSRPAVAPGLFWGALSGFASFVSHSGAPPFLVYVMPQKLEPKVFAGTSVLFFAVVNLLKVTPYFLLGQFSRENLMASAALLPLAVVAALFGIWLVKRMAADRFYNLVLLLSFVLGVKLIYDSLT
jgi:uncharacterized membrane protein YfcA